MAKEIFPESFICATTEFNTVDKFIPLPLFRRSFTVRPGLNSAILVIGSLGYYEAHINGEDITKGAMAPYRSNPDHYVYFDKYDVTAKLSAGKNVIGAILGNGIQNSLARSWKFWELPWRSSPKLCFSLALSYDDGTEETVISDEQTKCTDSPITFNDFHYGEYYDARLETENWDMPDFDDGEWRFAKLAVAPRGESRFAEIEPIVVKKELRPVSVTKNGNGYIYDFGVNDAGLYRLKIKGQNGQKLLLRFFEALVDGKPYYANIRLNDATLRYQEDEYICKGGCTEIHTPRFTYHGFQYVYVEGITPEQATEELLTYLVMCSDINQMGSFSCDDEVTNKIQQATLRSDFSNFYYFPTDCPQREKMGWTADAALSAEQMLLNMSPEKSLREWLKNIHKAILPSGQLPGVTPTGTWGYAWGNGPAWDAVIAVLPYFIYKYRGERGVLEDAAVPLMRYLTYLYGKLDDKGLIAIGLGDWAQVGRNCPDYDTPLVVSDSVTVVDIACKAAFIYDILGEEEQKLYAENLADKVTASIRRHLIDHEKLTAYGNTQTAQAMCLYYGMFTDDEKDGALNNLIDLINSNGGHFNTGVLGGRVIFRTLAQNGYADLAYNMITRPDFPSYGNIVRRGATTLWESFYSEESGKFDSLNHHFWGDVSAWFYIYAGGIRFNPTAKDINTLNIAPCFIKKLNRVTASHISPSGEIKVEWERNGDSVKLAVLVPDCMRGEIILPFGYCFSDGKTSLPLKSGEYIIEAKNP